MLITSNKVVFKYSCEYLNSHLCCSALWLIPGVLGLVELCWSHPWVHCLSWYFHRKTEICLWVNTPNRFLLGKYLFFLNNFLFKFGIEKLFSFPFLSCCLSILPTFWRNSWTATFCPQHFPVWHLLHWEGAWVTSSQTRPCILLMEEHYTPS